MELEASLHVECRRSQTSRACESPAGMLLPVQPQASTVLDGPTHERAALGGGEMRKRYGSGLQLMDKKV